MNATNTQQPPDPPRLKCTLIGFAAGGFSGLFGVGGGTVMVPGALSIPGVKEYEATAASLFAITVMASVGAGLQAGYGNLRPLDAMVVGIPAMVAVVGGTAIQQRLSPATVRVLFAGLLVIVGVLTISGLHPGQGHETTLGLIAAGAVGACAGIIAGLLGVGGGTLFVPALVFFAGLTQLKGEATSLLAIVPVSAVGAYSQYRYGNLRFKLAVPMALGSIPGALAGVAVVNLLPIRVVEVLFGLLLIWVAQHLYRRGRRAAEAAQPPTATSSP